MTPAIRQRIAHELREARTLAAAHALQAADLASVTRPGAQALRREHLHLASHHRRRAARLADELAALETA
jgi:hypothetical protein